MEQKIKVVIADDSRDMVEILREFLNKQSDMEVVGVASDGNEACTAVVDCEPDVLILDVIMPNLDGISVLEKLKEMPLKKRPVIIMLSAVGQDKITGRALALGAEYYIIKPFDMDALSVRIRQLISTQDTFKMTWKLDTRWNGLYRRAAHEIL